MTTTEYTSNHHQGQEAGPYSFFRIPKPLFTDPALSALSLEAKVLYGLMLDRMSLSVKNGWADPQGRVYIYFTLDEACRTLGTSRGKTVRVMKELDSVKGVGLIERKKQGQGKPTIIYVKPLIPETSAPQTSQIETSTVAENASLDVPQVDGNKTEKNQTEKNQTESLSPSYSLSQDDGFVDNDHGEREGVNLDVLDALYCQEELPYAYTADERRMTQAIHLLTGYDDHLGDSFEDGAHRLFNQALIAMLTDPKPMSLRGAHITYAKVYDRLQPYLDFGDTPTLGDLPDTAVTDFITACREREIRNHLGYMKSCIWYAIQVGDIAIQAQVERDMGT